MKTLKTILESSILGDIDDRINNMNNDVVDAGKLGYTFDIDRIIITSSTSTLNMINIRSLRNASKNLPAINDVEKHAIYGGGRLNREKMHLLLKWIDNIDISQFRNDDWSNKSTIKAFNIHLKDLLIKQSILNNPDNITIYVNNIHKGSIFEVFIFHNYRPRDMISIRYNFK